MMINKPFWLFQNFGGSISRGLATNKSWEQEVDNSFYKHSFIVLLFLLISRLLAMYFIPLNDSTEARYGEIARIMLETGDWITPMQSYGEPFWAKPPLSTWASALSMSLFGVNEFAARLPSLLFSIGILWLVWDLAKKRSGDQVAMIATLVLAGCLFFFLNAGTVMTDPALVFCTTLSMFAFWHAVVAKRKAWGYVFFAGLGLGLLAKGPVAIVLTGMPIFFWVLRHQSRWIALWKHLPWFTGGLLMLLIALPWYLLAELKTPGFINYFIVGENFHRFLDPGWGGDKYGFAHIAPLGMIWVYALAGIFPWSIMGLIWLAHRGKELPSLCKDNDGWISYLLLCTLVPLIFFTFSSNIIYPYVFPSLPAFALFFAEIAARGGIDKQIENRIASFASITGIIFLLVSALFVLKPDWVSKSQYRMITAFKNQTPAPNSRLIYWAHKTDYSARFYSAGRAVSTQDPVVLQRLLSKNTENYIVVDSTQKNAIPGELYAKLTEITTIHMQKNALILFRSSL